MAVSVRYWAAVALASLALTAQARNPRGAIPKQQQQVGSFTFSPTTGGPGTVITFTGTNMQYAVPQSLCQQLASGYFCTGLTPTSAGQQLGTIFDIPFTIVSPTEIQITAPNDIATGQFFFGNAQGASAYAQATFYVTSPIYLPANPPTLTAVASNGEVDLTFGPVINGDSYNIKRSTTSGSGYTTIGTVTTADNTRYYTDLTPTNGTTYYYVVTAVNNLGESGNSPQATATPAIPSAGSVTITVTPGTTQPISPYIYGANDLNGYFQSSSAANALPAGAVTLDRYGGNRFTAYNWTTNASNAGSDYLYENDAGLNTSPNNPAGQANQQITYDQANGVASLTTFQMQGYVAADESGPVSTTGTIPAPGRFDAVQYAKGSAFVTGSSIPLTGTVYMDEYAYNINYLFSSANVFSSSPTVAPVFGQLDNEPDIWYLTHLEVQGSTPITPAALVSKSVSLATALKNQYPNMKIFGAVNSGWSWVQNWNGAISGTTNTSNNWFIDYFAQAMASAAVTYGSPLVDVYDFHWYPQVVDSVSGGSIAYLNTSPLNYAQTQEIAQNPRSLYDSTYVENSYIPGTIGGNAINAIPRFQAKLASDNPGMKLSITEYYPGGGETIAGTLAEADTLGAFGATGLYAATLYPLQTYYSVAGGMAAFRNFDGAGNNFGNTSVLASSSNIANVSAYVSTDTTRSGRVVMVLINRSDGPQNVTVTGQTLSGTAHIYQMTSANVPSSSSGSPMRPSLIGTQAASGSSITLSLPYYSVTTVDIY